MDIVRSEKVSAWAHSAMQLPHAAPLSTRASRVSVWSAAISHLLSGSLYPGGQLPVTDIHQPAQEISLAYCCI